MEITSAQICDELLALLGQVKAHIGKLADTYGLTRIQLYALYTIEQQGGLAMGHVASALHCDASNVTGIVDRLVAQGLVVRQESEQDRRAKILQLTTAGKEMIADITSKLPVSIGCASLSSDERETLYDLVRKVAVTA